MRLFLRRLWLVFTSPCFYIGHSWTYPEVFFRACRRCPAVQHRSTWWLP